MPRVYHYGSFDGARLRAQSFIAAVKSWPTGTLLKFTVDRYVEEKSTPQNNFLHLLFDIAAREMNKEQMGDGEHWTTERVKEHCKREGLYPTIDLLKPGGEVVQVTKDTRYLDKEETGALIEKVTAYFADLGIILPPPNTQQSMTL